MSTRYRSARDRAAKHDPEQPVLRFHDLRHTFGTHVTTIKTLMGHADLATTQIYMHYPPQANLAARLSAIFRAPKPTGAATT